ncbi:GntR family transcriptional regulator [Cohnella rhizosphaerae]|uniref:GntR family transcriptional regulator n=1 Tax=Cohnella rhizosphaerae TaxID=1457232 RepID=A0A9X4KR06_9BACL|nr:GntR family transcriptional regulator [Cohnella rhizosphaerae]MDG0809295.1 GntR family transcriptional regulator [Cohnella rhizosphaerae]
MSDLPLAEVAYQELRQRLLSGKYLPGQLLSESELASGLGMSRTPVRAAVMQLEKEGFLETLVKRGILVKGIDVKELYDMFDLLNALYLFVLERMEQDQYEPDFERMRYYLDLLIEASERKMHREYYESGLMFMSTLLSTIGNRSIMETFDRYKDKVLYVVVAYRSTEGSNRPYTGKKLYAEIYRHLTEGNYVEAKAAIQASKRNSREELLRNGYKV